MVSVDKARHNSSRRPRLARRTAGPWRCRRTQHLPRAARVVTAPTECSTSHAYRSAVRGHYRPTSLAPSLRHSPARRCRAANDRLPWLGSPQPSGGGRLHGSDRVGTLGAEVSATVERVGTKRDPFSSRRRGLRRHQRVLGYSAVTMRTGGVRIPPAELSLRPPRPPVRVLRCPEHVPSPSQTLRKSARKSISHGQCRFWSFLERRVDMTSHALIS